MRRYHFERKLRAHEGVGKYILMPWHSDFKAADMNFGYFSQLTIALKKTLWVFFDNTSRVSFRLTKVVEKAVPEPLHPEFRSSKHEFWIFCSIYQP